MEEKQQSTDIVTEYLAAMDWFDAAAKEQEEAEASFWWWFKIIVSVVSLAAAIVTVWALRVGKPMFTFNISTWIVYGVWAGIRLSACLVAFIVEYVKCKPMFEEYNERQPRAQVKVISNTINRAKGIVGDTHIPGNTLNMACIPVLIWGFTYVMPKIFDVWYEHF